MKEIDYIYVSKFIGMIALYLFLPLTAITYNLFRRYRRDSEIKRIFKIMRVDAEYQAAFEDRKPGRHFLLAVFYASLVSCIGFVVLFLGPELKLDAIEGVKIWNAHFPQQGSWLVVGMAFMGGYLWGLQHLFRRYATNDLMPAVYYSLSIRMVLAAVIALLIYNAFRTVAGGDGTEGGMTWNVWPALAFMIGMFPRRGLNWLSDRIPILSQSTDPSVRQTPLDMIEGITVHDRMRLEEEGIDTCYDLAVADFVPLILKTPYSARELVDWILQAKLCVQFGDAVTDLRQNGIRTVIDLKRINQSDIEALATETSLTKSALQCSRDSIENDAEIKRLQEARDLLGKFWNDKN
jgi:hypothetical protein